jgi:hypothetical protein
MSASPVERYVYGPIRSVNLVVDLEDPLSPELPLREFVRANGAPPSPPRYRVLELELAVCPEDHQPVLLAECGGCPKFVKRSKRHVCCRRVLV